MSKKRALPTDTISFRADSKFVQAVKSAAKDEGISLGEYIMGQIDPSSQLGKMMGSMMADTVLDRDSLRHNVVQSAMSEILVNQPAIRTAFVDFITGLTQLKEQSDREGHNFSDVLEQTISSVAQQKVQEGETDQQ